MATFCTNIHSCVKIIFVPIKIRIAGIYLFTGLHIKKYFLFMKQVAEPPFEHEKHH
jgi:hypothetical protein